MPEQIPIFPLHVVLFPGGSLPLRIFEARYLDMVSTCLRDDSGFGVCLIREGSEVGAAATTAAVGTHARICDWDRNPDGLLSITIKGERRLRLISTHIQADNLVRGEVTWLEDEQPCPVTAGYQTLQELADRLITKAGVRDRDVSSGMDDAVWLGYRLAELLPISMQQRQFLLEMTDPLQRLARLQDYYTALLQLNAD